MALQDKLPEGFDRHGKLPQEKFALLRRCLLRQSCWYHLVSPNHVVPRIGIKICIIGRGFQGLKHELECDGKVEVIGAVDHLAEW